MVERLKEYNFADLARKEEINLSALADGVLGNDPTPDNYK
jgi:hypothetical protein